MDLGKKQQGAIVAIVAVIPLVFGLLMYQFNQPECTKEWGWVHGSDPPIFDYIETCEDTSPYRTLGASLAAFGFILLLGATVYVVILSIKERRAAEERPPQPPAR